MPTVSLVTFWTVLGDLLEMAVVAVFIACPLTWIWIIWWCKKHPDTRSEFEKEHDAWWSFADDPYMLETYESWRRREPKREAYDADR